MKTISSCMREKGSLLDRIEVGTRQTCFEALTLAETVLTLAETV